jgi:3-keto-5-aminohexanoate cleavage enzyme
MTSAMSKLIITAAITGGELNREQQPALPLTPREIGIAAAHCAEAGAAVVHVHGRLADGTPTQDREVYRRILAEVRERSDVIVQFSTGGSVGMTADERLAPVELGPEMASLTMGSVNFGDSVFLNSPGDIARFAQAMLKHKVRPELEIFDSGMLSTALYWLEQGRLPRPAHFNFVLGVPGAMAGTAESLMHLRSLLPQDATWTVSGIGAKQLGLTTLAVVLGGHVRVGFEDNVYYRRGQLAHSNAQLVARVARISHELDRPIASPAQARALLMI